MKFRLILSCCGVLVVTILAAAVLTVSVAAGTTASLAAPNQPVTPSRYAEAAEARRGSAQVPHGLPLESSDLAPFSVSPPITLTDPSWRIGITADGLYRLSHTSLVSAGVPLTGVAPSALRLSWRGQEVALQELTGDDASFDPGDSLLFYAEKFHGSTQDEKYTDENVYWLSVDPPGPGQRMDTRSVTPDGTGQPLAWYTATVHAEEDVWYWTRWSKNPGTDATWFWDDVTAAAPLTRSYSITLTAPVADVYTGALAVDLAGRSDNFHRVRFSLNGVPVGDVTWTGTVGFTATLPLSATLIQEGVNAVEMTVLTDGGTQRLYLNWFEVTYRRHPQAEGDVLFWTTPITGTSAVTLTGFSTATVSLYDITHPLTPTRLLSATAFPSGTTYAVALRDTAPEGSAYLAVGESAPREADELSIYHAPDSLISSTVGADEIIIAPGAFLTAVQPLVDLRVAQGLRVQVVDVDDIYALYNGGVFHPQAIQSFVTHAYQHWPAPAPAYLLLVGDGHINFKGHNPTEYGDPPPNWIPPFLAFADYWMGEVPLDTLYGDTDGGGLPEVMVGRIPAASVAEVETVVAKILAYEADPAPSWRDRLLFAADNDTEGGSDYQNAIETLRAMFPSWMDRPEVYIRDYCGAPVSPPQPCPSATLALTQTWSQGAAAVVFAGHGSINRWAHERLLVLDDIATFEAGADLPFVLTLVCLDGSWAFPPKLTGFGSQTRSMAETLLVTPDRGAVAAFSPAGLGTLPAGEPIGHAVMRALFIDDIRGLGELTHRGREAVATSQLARTYTLFGDPAMHLTVISARHFLPVVIRTP